MNQKIILDSIAVARQQGYKIINGAIFDFSSGNKACSVLGAVLVADGKAELFHKGFYPGWLKHLCFLLETNEEWVYRFSMGYDRTYQIEIDTGKYDKKNRVIYIFDDVSKYGISLKKEID